MLPHALFFLLIFNSFYTYSQSLATDAHGNKMLLGKISRKDLEQDPFNSWFNKMYQEYQVDSSPISRLMPLLQGKQFTIFMGTWCGDSRMEVPKWYKLLDLLKVPDENITFIAVNYHDSAYKQSPTHEEKGLNIHRVPSLLVFDKQQEIGRIVEKPVETLEKDLLAIATSKSYVPNYKAAHYLAGLFKTKKTAEVETGFSQLVDTLRPMVKNTSELTSYGNVLISANEANPGIMVLRLNAGIFPTNANVMTALADAYYKNGDMARAKDHYQKVLAIQPGHERATAMLARLMN